MLSTKSTLNEGKLTLQGFTRYESAAAAAQSTSNAIRANIRQSGGIDPNTQLKLYFEKDAQGNYSVPLFAAPLLDNQNRQRMNGNTPIMQTVLNAYLVPSGKEVQIPYRFLDTMAMRWEKEGDQIVRKERVTGNGELNALYHGFSSVDAALSEIARLQDTEHPNGFFVNVTPVQTIEFIEDAEERRKTSFPADAHQLTTTNVYNVDWAR